LKCDGTRAETRFRLSTKRTSPFKLAGASNQSTTGRRAVHISLQGLYCSCKPMFCSHVTLTGYPLQSLVSPSLLPCVTVCHHISTGLYQFSSQLGQYRGSHFSGPNSGHLKHAINFPVLFLHIHNATYRIWHAVGKASLDNINNST
jgi:hypothetical protein